MTQKYQCSNCKYKFTPKAGKVPSRCPYCDKPTIAPMKGMQDLLDEVGNEE